MEAPELNYEPTRWEFYKDSEIPKILAGGVLGLYAAVVVGCFCSATLIILRKRSLPVADDV